MLRAGNIIRLTPSEKATLEFLAGYSVNPKTVDELERIAGNAKAEHDFQVANTAPDSDENGSEDRRGHAESRLMAAMAEHFLAGVK
jgi:hypothetical protein